VDRKPTTVSLVWSDTSNVAWSLAYRVHTGPGVWINVAVSKLPTAAQPFVLSGLYPGSNYDIQVGGITASNKRGPFSDAISARTRPGTIDGIYNIFARFNTADKQLHVKWKNSSVAYTSMALVVKCAGNTATFTITATNLQDYPIKSLPEGSTGCSVRLTPSYGTKTGTVFTQSFDTL